MDIGSFTVNVDAQEKGVRKDLGNGAWVLVASVRSTAYIEAMVEAMKPYRIQLNNDTLTDDKAFELRAGCMARHILKGWGGITENGEEVPYSVDTAEKWLKDKAKRPFHDLVLELAQDIKTFQDGYEAAALGNSPEALNPN